MNDLRSFVEEIMKEAGVWEMDPILREPIIQNLLIQVQRQIGIAAMVAMDDKTVDEYEKMMEKEPLPPPEEVVNFLQGKIPNFQEVLTEALKQFADEYITGAKRLMAEAKASTAAVS